eukprot:scaffold1237_cov243-Pinguiococcus_pyrenoidosus.AAC.18
MATPRASAPLGAAHLADEAARRAGEEAHASGSATSATALDSSWAPSAATAGTPGPGQLTLSADQLTVFSALSCVLQERCASGSAW